MPFEFDDLVDEVMRSHPTTIRIFLDFKMGCVGCPIACFHTLTTPVPNMALIAMRL